MKPSEQVRLVRVITRLNVGGPARHVTILSTRMGPGFNGTLLVGASNKREGSLIDEAIAAGARVQRVPGLQRALNPINDARTLLWLYRYFRKERPDIVATHTAKAGALGRLAAFLAGVPVRIHTYHGHVLQGYFGPAVSTVFRSVERLLSGVTTRVIAISPWIAADLIRMDIGRGRISVVRNGLDLEELKNGRPGRLRADLGVAEGVPLVGIVGRLAPIKAHELFLQAAALVLRQHPQAQFVIVGDGELWDSLHRRVDALGLAGVVHFTGWRQDLAEVYADLAVAVCCSINEGTPVSVIEAAAAGKPVVGTRVGGMPDIVQDGVNGFLIPSGDAPALARSISRLLADPVMAARMGQAGQHLALAHHSADRMVDDMRRLYARLLEEKNGAIGS
jgi:glycosyltransferase involved in cell wall biosynthesis